MRNRDWSAFADGIEITDRDLVIAFKGGDSHAYAVIYREYRPLAESICHRILQNPDDAAEAAQETMLKVFQGLPRFNGRYLLRAWVARIATNVCLDMIRKRQRRIDEVDSPEAESLEKTEDSFRRAEAEDPSEIAARTEEGERIRALLRDLPPHHRDALVMREFDGRSHEDIGAALGMTAPQVKALIHRAKKGFRRAWEVQGSRASAFTWPALLVIPFRWFRRVAQPARDAAEVAASPVIQLTSQPAIAQATVVATDRVAAAAGALLVAGTIGIGAAALPNRPQQAPKQPAVVVAEQAVEQEVAVAARPAAPVAPGTEVVAGPKGRAFRPGPRPSVETPTDAQPTEGEPTPAPEPSQQGPQPSPQPAPKYEMSFRLGTTEDHECGCSAEPRLVESRGTAGTPGGSMSFGQAVEGAAIDAAGKAAYGLYLRYDGSVDAGTGSLTVEFKLKVDSENLIYRAQLSLQSRVQSGSTWRYTFTGTYALYSASGGAERVIPDSGSITTDLSFWSDGTIYRAATNL